MRRSVVHEEECGAYSFLQTCSYLIKSFFQFTVLQKLHIQSTLTCAREGTYVIQEKVVQVQTQNYSRSNSTNLIFSCNNWRSFS